MTVNQEKKVLFFALFLSLEGIFLGKGLLERLEGDRRQHARYRETELQH